MQPGQAPAVPLLAEHEPPPHVELNRDARGCGLVTCDHASNRVPEALDGLGLSPEQLGGHIAWDPGAAPVARALAAALDLPLIEAGYSRLVVDCNRAADSRSCMPPISDGVLIPGNVSLDEPARVRRRETFYWPYHHAISERLDALERGGLTAVLIAVHSFTPTMHGVGRRMQVGVLWDRDPRLALPLIAALRARGVRVGDNEPYSGRHPADFTVDNHAERFGRPCVSLELRQDLVADERGQHHWAAVIAQCLRPLLADEALYRPLADAGSAVR